MIKKSIISMYGSTLILFSCAIQPQSSQGDYDKRAVKVLDDVSEKLSSLSSCSFSLKTTIGSAYSQTQMFHDSYFKGPNKMYIHSIGSKGDYCFWYDGNKASYLDYATKTYDVVSAGSTTLETIDKLHAAYGIEFHASDFFYPTFTDDILKEYSKVHYIGEEKIYGEVVIKIEASNNEEILSITIDKKTHLPYSMMIESRNNTNELYECSFANWKVNPVLPDVFFEFTPPADAIKSPFQSKSN